MVAAEEKRGNTVLQGAKVVLRDKQLSDAPQDYAWRSDPELARYDAAPPLRSSYQEFLQSYEESLRYPGFRRRRFAIDDHTGKHIGNCTLYDIDEHRGQAELGITIGERTHWGQGYGTDAVGTVLRHVFKTTKLERVYLHTLDWNVRAQRCFAKCGFTEVDRVRQNSQAFIRMEIHRHQWETLQTREDGDVLQEAPSSTPS